MEFVILFNLQLNKRIKTLFLSGRKKKRIMKNVIWDRPKQESVGLSSSTSKTVMVASVWHFFLETCESLKSCNFRNGLVCKVCWIFINFSPLHTSSYMFPHPGPHDRWLSTQTCSGFIMPATSGWKISTLSMRDLLTDAFPRCAEKCVRDHCCAPSVSPGPPPDWSNLQGTERHNALFL